MESLDFDKSRLLPIRIRRGQTVDFDIPVKNSDGTDFDFTGFDAELLVYNSFSKTDSPVLQFKTTDSTLVLTEGNIHLSQPSPITFKREEFVYLLWVTDSDGIRQPWTNGPFLILNRQWDNTRESDSLTINLSGTPVEIIINPTIEDYPVIIKTISADSYTVLESDNGKMIHYTSDTAVTITLPDDLSDGHITQHVKKGDGDLTFTASTLESVGDTLATQYSAALSVHEGDNVWGLYGNLT